ncbi:uncharacterized protein LOC115984327 isoform X8 [Quercus lobata]|uniref:uncharacterized protein LOC115984327 isoform X8 n=1 Tax=Quercus lobata TaxID=97700 RepID=UPI0012447DBE|nr:uncharacterized protein LOC115984327 isoform X8 [Quercus lobata]
MLFFLSGSLLLRTSIPDWSIDFFQILQQSTCVQESHTTAWATSSFCTIESSGSYKTSAGIIMKQQGLFVHVIFMVISAGVLRTRPYLGPFWVLELNSSLFICSTVGTK